MKRYNLEVYMPQYDESQLWSFNPMEPDADEAWVGNLTDAKKLKKLLEQLPTNEEFTIIEADD